MQKHTVLVLAVAACLSAAGVLSASALGVSILLPPDLVLRGKTIPLKIPRTTPKPITLTLEGQTSEPGAAEERPPALKNLSLRFDKNGAIFTKSLAVCTFSRVPDIGWGPHCPEALVGRGVAEIEVKVPEEPASSTKAPLEIFNGAPRDGRPVLIYKVQAHVPATTTIVSSGVIEKGYGRFGTQTTIEIPSISSGEGSLIGFRAKIGKTWTYRGKKVSLLTADCPRGSLIAHAKFELVDGFRAKSKLVDSCG